jgi:hypothetical protein
LGDSSGWLDSVALALETAALCNANNQQQEKVTQRKRIGCLIYRWKMHVQAWRISCDSLLYLAVLWELSIFSDIKPPAVGWHQPGEKNGQV